MSGDIQHYLKMCKQFGVNIVVSYIFNKDIQYAHKYDSLQQKKASKHCNTIQNDNLSSKLAYSKALESYLDSQSILLDENGKHYSSLGFSELLGHFLFSQPSRSMQHKTLASLHNGVKFFIAGAFGFHSSLLSQYHTLSLSTLTFSHKIAKIVL
ncbi:23S rRNA (pseudouridine(1915)-N(3))-methyltransferase RlmH [Helicobacter aurati]|uniref:23S rRNA (pseudouridine(1915)-N(3))-methyltransferase RlmH n=1 Tax=Helicobacter aurati TaxID=137778 RepID=UPI001F400868|nr:23S rRNA (pseudouridine(1915)-N(3))-methyltransferase RlmH [Helicobacter aurati]